MDLMKADKIVRREAFANALVIQLIPDGVDELTGEPIYKRVTSIMLIDPEMEQPLRDLAREILGL